MQRLTEEARISHDVSIQSATDIALLCNALTYLASNAEHIDSRDMSPVYEVVVEGAYWRAKGLLEAVAEALAQNAD